MMRSPQTVYWYAPFDNAGELLTAACVAQEPDVDLTVQAISDRFGQRLDLAADGPYSLVRDLPPPSGERGRRRTVWSRLGVAVDRARRRHRLVKAGAFEVVHLHTYNPYTDWLAVPLLRRHTSSVILSIHNAWPHDVQLPRAVLRVALGLGYRACDHVIVTHDILMETIARDFGVSPESISVVPFPTTMPQLERESSDDDEGTPVRFLFFGTLRRNKGVDTLLDALKVLGGDEAGRRRTWTMTIAGRGDPELEREVIDVARQIENVEAEIGYVSEGRRAGLYMAADCVVLPYRHMDAQSGVLYDAYANSLPVIATNVGPLGQAVASDRSGWIVDPDSPSDLARVMSEVCAEPGQRAEAASRAALAASKRTPAASAAATMAVYRQVFGDSRVQRGHRVSESGRRA